MKIENDNAVTDATTHTLKVASTERLCVQAVIVLVAFNVTIPFHKTVTLEELLGDWFAIADKKLAATSATIRIHKIVIRRERFVRLGNALVVIDALNRLLIAARSKELNFEGLCRCCIFLDVSYFSICFVQFRIIK